ncbi:hypothetical protein LCGC14_0979960 [marine sediment metagenome]|uniref:Uncharacterized protein n=1 Tax=marine sediment metagenome TaxID=412755 RepID=A0A0F9NDI2_9ZZZZ
MVEIKVWTTPEGEKLTLKQFIQRWWKGIEKVPIVKKMNKVEGILK